jgi:chitin synthase
MVPEKKEDNSGVSFIEGAIIRAQYVEYKVSHYLDKATESLFGFVSVLPGAFSTFRWDCINGAPLDTFLLGAKDEFGDIHQIAACSKANKYLAEDRIMCLEIIAKEKENFIIHYIPGAKCLTDPPMSLTELIKQRRRWFNGSMFATFHVLTSMCRIWKRRNSFIRNLWFMILYFYMIIQTVLSFILVGLFFAAFSIFVRKAFEDDDCLNIFKTANFLENLYLVFLLAVLLLSITVDVKHAETGYRICSFAMGCFSILMVVATILYAARVESLDSSANYVIIFIGIWLLSYIMPLLLNITKLKVEDFIKGVIYCSFLSPTYVNIFTIFAISNIHDVSWGSRPAVIDPLTAKVEGEKQEKYKNYRANFLVVWILINLATGGAITILSRNGNENFIFFVSLGLAVIIGFKIVLALVHSILS